MTKKNFVALAGILNAAWLNIPKIEWNDKTTPELHNFTTLVVNLCDYLKTTNPRFDQKRFLEAVYKC